MTKSGEQQTVVWHVDDLRASHVDLFKNTGLIHYLRNIYGNNMSITRGIKHRYLGMDLDYSEPVSFKVSMVDCFDEMFEEFQETIEKSAPSLHSDNRFKVQDKECAGPMLEEQAEMFFHMVAQPLFLTCCARQDIQTAMAFWTM